MLPLWKLWTSTKLNQTLSGILGRFLKTSGAARISVRGNILGGRPRRGSGGRSPPDARKFWKFPKNFSRKLQKTDYFRRFFKKLKTLREIFALWTKNYILWEIFEKIFKNFFEKSTKCIIFVYFQNNFKTLRKFSRVLTKNIIVWKFLRKFSKIFLWK